MPPIDERRLWVILITLLTATALVFSIWPQLDIFISSLFYQPDRGFWINRVPGLASLREFIWNSLIGLFLASLLMLLFTALRGPVWGITARVWGWISLVYILGPGLLVNVILKEYWGRARPANILEFGGANSFTPPLQIADQCAKNCSFVSGEGAGATAFFLAILILSRFIKNVTLRWVVVAVGLLLSVTGISMRLLKGRHFFSDTIFSVLFVCVIALVLYRLFFGRSGKPKP